MANTRYPVPRALPAAEVVGVGLVVLAPHPRQAANSEQSLVGRTDSVRMVCVSQRGTPVGSVRDWSPLVGRDHDWGIVFSVGELPQPFPL